MKLFFTGKNPDFSTVKKKIVLYLLYFTVVKMVKMIKNASNCNCLLFSHSKMSIATSSIAISTYRCYKGQLHVQDGIATHHKLGVAQID